jgi:hypothetical protein
MEKLETIQQTTAELYTEILSNSRHPQHQTLRSRINEQSKEMSSIDYKSPTLDWKYPEKEWKEGITIRNMTDLLFWSGSVSVKQVAWLVRYAIKHNVQL